MVSSESKFKQYGPKIPVLYFDDGGCGPHPMGDADPAWVTAMFMGDDGRSTVILGTETNGALMMTADDAREFARNLLEAAGAVDADNGVGMEVADGD